MRKFIYTLMVYLMGSVVAHATPIRVHAWGGSEATDTFLQWLAGAVENTYGMQVDLITSPHIPNTTDIIWMQSYQVYEASARNQLLSNWVSEILSGIYIDSTYTHKTEQAIPWGRGYMVFLYESAIVSTPPKNMQQLLSWTQQNQGAFAYPFPTSSEGLAFLKQIVWEMMPDTTILTKPALKNSDRLTFLWAYLDALHPFIWGMPQDIQHLHQLIKQQIITLGISTTPYGTARAINNNWLPKTAKIQVPLGGAVGTVHYWAIPKTAPNPEGAKVFIDFVLTPLMQYSKASPDFWGDMTILHMDKIGFEATLFDKKHLPKIYPKMHPSWDKKILGGWMQRYGDERDRK